MTPELKKTEEVPDGSRTGCNAPHPRWRSRASRGARAGRSEITFGRASRRISARPRRTQEGPAGTAE